MDFWPGFKYLNGPHQSVNSLVEQIGTREAGLKWVEVERCCDCCTLMVGAVDPEVGV